MMSNISRLVMINATDLEYITSHPNILEDRSNWFCPVDKPAATFCISKNLQFITVDDWLTSEEIDQARSNAANWERNWFESKRATFTTEGICWPEFDRQALSLFWRECFLCNVLAQKIVENKVKELVAFTNAKLKPSEYDSHADVYSIILQSMLVNLEVEGDIKVRLINKGKGKRLIKKIWHSFKTLALTSKNHTYTRPSVRYDESGDNFDGIDIVFLLHFGEYSRFGPFLRNLKEMYPGRVGCLFLYQRSKLLSEFREEMGIPVQDGLDYNKDDSRPEYQAAFETIKGESSGLHKSFF